MEFEPVGFIERAICDALEEEFAEVGEVLSLETPADHLANHFDPEPRADEFDYIAEVGTLWDSTGRRCFGNTIGVKWNNGEITLKNLSTWFAD